MPKILLIRLSSIGDIVLTSPVIRCLKQQLAHVELHYLVKPGFKAILDVNPYIDKCHELSPHLATTIQQLRAEKYDYIIDLQHNLLTLRLKWALWRVASASFYKLNIEKWVFTNFKINYLPAVHIVDRYMATLSHFGIINDAKGLDYFIPPSDEINISRYFPDINTRPYIAIAIGAAHATKQVPADILVVLCKQLRQPIILLGGKADTTKGNDIAQQAGEHTISVCGQFNLHQSASIIRQAAVVITPDTGLMHIAAAFGKHIVSIWGNTVPQFGMYPYLPAEGSHIAEVPHLTCRPCSKIGHSRCPKGHFNCMNQQNIAQIVQKVEELVNK